jgi:hypothetical protein
MTRFMSLQEFRRRFKVVNPLDLAASEPNKYCDPFIEWNEYKEGSVPQS